MTGGLADRQELSLGAAILRPATCELIVLGRGVTLEPQVMRALLALAERQGQVVSRSTLIEAAWGGRAVSEDAINHVISRLRKLATDTGAFQLTTHRKVGYRLTATTSEALAAETEPSVRTPRRRNARRLVLAALAIFAVAVAAFAIWRFTAPSTPDIASLAVAPIRPAEPSLAPEAASLTTDLQATLSRMKGLRLVDAAAPVGQGPALLLTGAVSPGAPQSTVTLILTDQHSHARVWSAAFDSRGVTDPTVRERALSAAARYLAIWLGDRTRGEPAAHEPADPEITRMIADARQVLSAAHQARHNRDWATFARLERQTKAVQAKVLAKDPNSPQGLMLGYQLATIPEFPRPDETQADYEARRLQAAQYLARALAADPDDTDALAATAREYTRTMRWAEADKLLERAVAIDPNSPDANTWYAYSLATSGRCEAALRHARISAGLMPQDSWRQMAVPRMLHCAGRTEEAAKAYRDLLSRDPGNAFVLHDLYLMQLGARDAAHLRTTATEIEAKLWRGRPPADIAQLLARMRMAADALNGRPAPFLSVLEAEDRAIGGPDPRPGSGVTKFGSTWGDQAFMLAFEYAEAGNAERALDLLRQAVNAGSVYLPWALPDGPHEFPPAVRADPAYAAIWKSSPGVAALIERRRQAGKPQDARPD